MYYVGGKNRLAIPLRNLIATHAPCGGTYLEPFLGGANSFAAIAPMFTRTMAGDTHPDLMLFWEAIRSGWRPPARISQAEYQRLKTAEPSALRGAAGFCCSYRGKWFGGWDGKVRWTRCDQIWRDQYTESVNHALRKAGSLAAADLRHQPYWDWKPEPGTVVYCDPPYADTTGYGKSFDTARFWQVASDWAANGAHVFVSEYTAPEPWQAIARFKSIKSLNRQTETAECVFTL